MSENEILAVLRSFFAARVNPLPEPFESQRPTQFLQTSMEAMELVFHLEDATGVELGLAEIGPAVANATFAELAKTIRQMMSK